MSQDLEASRLSGDMAYKEMLAALVSRYGLEPGFSRQLHGRWKSMGRAARSPAWEIGTKYV